MAQTRMFRDRVVSMEQTLEGGEKHLPLLKELCREALPELELREYSLDHERDLFVMDLVAPNGAPKRICWTRMVLFDAERIPTLAGEQGAALRAKIVGYVRARSAQPEIVVTFRHLEDGWVDTPEPRRESRRRRRGGRGRGGERGAERRPGSERPAAPPRSAGPPPRPPAPKGAPPPQAARPGPRPGVATAEGGAPGGTGKRRRRFRRRRRGRGPGGGGGGSAPPTAPAP